MKSGFNRLSSRMGGWGQSVVVDLTQQQEDILLRLQSFMGASVPSVRSPAQAYSVGVRYLMGVATLLYGDIATPHDCALKDSVDVRATPRKLYASLPDGGYAERRIRGLNF